MKKKMLALFMAATMVMGMGMTAFAEESTQESYSIKIESTVPGHTYEAYQIFVGTLDTTSSKVLSDIQWGESVSDAGKATFGAASDVAATIKSTELAAAFANEVSQYLLRPTATDTFDDGKYVFTGLANGYYLIKDKDATLDGSNDTYTNFILKVAGENVTAKPKSGTVTNDKSVKDINDSIEGSESEWQNSADYDIGDHVPFQLKGTLPENYATYKTYYYEFVDQMEKGLEFDNDSLKVYYVKGDTTFSLEEPFYKVNVANAQSFSVEFSDLKANSDITYGTTIYVEFTATLTTDANIGSVGNKNNSHIKYSNNPNGDGFGETPDDTVIVFTYELDVNKVDGATELPLGGAGFSLYKKDVNKTEGTLLSSDDFNTIKKDSEVNNFYLVKEIEAKEENALFTFRGVDDGEYVLVESVVPDGYNSIKPYRFAVTANHTEDSLGEVTGVGEVIKFTLENNALTTSIANYSGSTLPETGGMGTTIFYIVGIALVVCGGAVLFARKRMNGEEA